ncbi:hypothetical protein HMPREF0663_11336 [Hoylesella oralis ATCC 33269]|uniref:Uncharacterized protein n=1 Tax=Hoylesella oralis ATCC 33269 TaxID=873533 RepID=E7RQ85_9BACT|nr:hypothetical protein HMPREF0663_11336 [Hoylesella oralis ATCC 33269]
MRESRWLPFLISRPFGITSVRTLFYIYNLYLLSEYERFTS